MKKTIITLALVVTGVANLFVTPISYAAPAASSPKDLINEGVNKTGGSTTTGTSLNKTLNTITDTMLFLVGAIAVIMMIIGGIRYTTSNGDPSQTKAAKDTIMYAAIGIVVALLAYAIVKWIITQFV